jgi:hypothetical protein
MASAVFVISLTACGSSGDHAARQGTSSTGSSGPVADTLAPTSISSMAGPASTATPPTKKLDVRLGTTSATSAVVTLTVPRTWSLSRTQPEACCNIPPTVCLVSGRADWANDPDNCVLTVTWAAHGVNLSPDMPRPVPNRTCHRWATTQDSDQPIQGRPAEYRAFLNRCTGLSSEMWTVMSAPQIAFWHPITNGSTHAAAAAIIASAVLPPVTDTSRQFDEGLLKALIHTPAGYRITIDRVVGNLNGTLINNNPATYTYALSQGLGESGPWTFTSMDQVLAQVRKGTHPADGTPPLAGAYVEIVRINGTYQLMLFAPAQLNS